MDINTLTRLLNKSFEKIESLESRLEELNQRIDDCLPNIMDLKGIAPEAECDNPIQRAYDEGFADGKRDPYNFVVCPDCGLISKPVPSSKISIDRQVAEEWVSRAQNFDFDVDYKENRSLYEELRKSLDENGGLNDKR